jgi:hypothetical protein
MREKQEAFAGLVLGAAVGLLVGMSNTPVTAIVVSSLVALIATFFGLSSQHAEGVKALRIASFGLACPIAIFVALAARTHGWLTPVHTATDRGLDNRWLHPRRSEIVCGIS